MNAVPEGVAQIRREICSRANCPHLSTLNFNDPCAVCPGGHWPRYSPLGCDDPKRKVPLGSRIAAIARPIARGIDKLAGTSLAECGGCKQMEKDLNAGMSMGKAVRKRFRRK